jgi:hypothetical protein
LRPAPTLVEAQLSSAMRTLDPRRPDGVALPFIGEAPFHPSHDRDDCEKDQAHLASEASGSPSKRTRGNESWFRMAEKCF